MPNVSPSPHASFQPAWGLANRHVQTLFAPVFRKQTRLDFLRERWITPDQDTLHTIILNHRDFTTNAQYQAHREAGRKPVAILLHGLEGSVESPYISGIAQHLVKEQFTVVAFNQRSCGGFMNQARRLYHLGETEDLGFVVDQVKSRFPGSPIALAGVSLGANQLAKWLATHEVPDEVRCAALLSPPFDLTTSGRHMDRNMRPYVRYFLNTLIPKAIEKEAQYPGCVDVDAVSKSITFEEYDTHATAALHGFLDAHDYYKQVSCGPFMSRICVPTLVIASQDDPFNPGTTIPIDVVGKNPHLHGVFPLTGGHVGFVSGSIFRPHFWAENLTARFLTKHT